MSILAVDGDPSKDCFRRDVWGGTSAAYSQKEWYKPWKTKEKLHLDTDGTADGSYRFIVSGGELQCSHEISKSKIGLCCRKDEMKRYVVGLVCHYTRQLLDCKGI